MIVHWDWTLVAKAFLTCDLEKKDLQCSTKQFFHDAKHKERKRTTRNGVEKDTDIQETARRMPIEETSDSDIDEAEKGSKFSNSIFKLQRFWRTLKA